MKASVPDPLPAVMGLSPWSGGGGLSVRQIRDLNPKCSVPPLSPPASRPSPPSPANTVLPLFLSYLCDNSGRRVPVPSCWKRRLGESSSSVSSPSPSIIALDSTCLLEVSVQRRRPVGVAPIARTSAALRTGCACGNFFHPNWRAEKSPRPIQVVAKIYDSKAQVKEEMELGRRAGAFLVLACTFGSLGLLVSPVVQGRESASVSFVKKTIAAHSIVIFSKSYCPYCKRAKAVFKDLNETPYVVELDMREDGAKIQEALSLLVKRHTVPQVFIDGEHIGGSDDTVEAYKSGRLKQLLGFRQSGEQDLR